MRAHTHACRMRHRGIFTLLHLICEGRRIKEEGDRVIDLKVREHSVLETGFTCLVSSAEPALDHVTPYLCLSLSLSRLLRSKQNLRGPSFYPGRFCSVLRLRLKLTTRSALFTQNGSVTLMKFRCLTNTCKSPAPVSGTRTA